MIDQGRDVVGRRTAPTPAPSAADGENSVGTGRRALHLLLALIAVACLAGGGALLWHLPGAESEIDQYTNAPPCLDQVVTGRPPTCFVYVPAMISGTHVEHTWFGREQAFVDFAFGSNLSGGAEFNDDRVFRSLQPGQRVNLKVWSHTVFAITTADAVVRVPDNPRNVRPVQLDGGLALLAMGAVILVALASRRRRASGPCPWPLLAADALHGAVLGAPSRLRHSGVRGSLQFRSVRRAAEALVVAELLDAVTSVIGNHLGAVEVNPLASAVVRAIGPAGFALLKVPIVVGLLLLASRLSPRAATWLLWAATAVTLVVVISNQQVITS